MPFRKPMFDFEVRLVLAPDHPLASKTQITPESRFQLKRKKNIRSLSERYMALTT